MVLQGELEQHGLVLEEIEAVAGHLGAGFEVDQVEPLGQLDVVERFEVELGRLVRAAADFQVRLVVGPQRRVGVRHVGDRSQDGVRLGGQAVELELGLRRFFAQGAAFGLAGFALGGVLGLADRLADFVGAAIELVDLGLHPLAFGFQRDEPAHVGRRAAALAVELHQVGMFHDESAVEHGATSSSSTHQVPSTDTCWT